MGLYSHNQRLNMLKKHRQTDVMVDYTIPHSVEGGMGGYAYAHEVASKCFPYFRVDHKGKVNKEDDGKINNAYHSGVDFILQPMDIFRAIQQDIKSISGKKIINFNFLALYKKWPDGNLGGVSEADCGKSDGIDFVPHPLSFIVELQKDGIDIFSFVDDMSVTIHEYSRYQSLYYELMLFDNMMSDWLLNKKNFKIIFVNLKDRDLFIERLGINSSDDDRLSKIFFKTVSATTPTDEKYRGPLKPSDTLKVVSFGHQQISQELNEDLKQKGLLTPYGLMADSFDPDPLSRIGEDKDAIALLRMDKAGDKYVGVRTNAGSAVCFMSKGLPTCAVLGDAAPPWLSGLFRKAVLTLNDPATMNKASFVREENTIECQINHMMDSIRKGEYLYDEYITACEQSYAAYMLYHSRVVTAQSLKLIYQITSPDEKELLINNAKKMQLIINKFKKKHPEVHFQSYMIDMIVFQTYRNKKCLFEKCKEYIWQYENSDTLSQKSHDDIASQATDLTQAIENALIAMDSDHSKISRYISNFMFDLNQSDYDYLSSLTNFDLVYFRSTQAFCYTNQCLLVDNNRIESNINHVRGVGFSSSM